MTGGSSCENPENITKLIKTKNNLKIMVLKLIYILFHNNGDEIIKAIKKLHFYAICGDCNLYSST